MILFVCLKFGTQNSNKARIKKEALQNNKHNMQNMHTNIRDLISQARL